MANQQKQPSPSALTPLQIGAIVAVVLSGVVLGSWVTLRKTDHDRAAQARGAGPMDHTPRTADSSPAASTGEAQAYAPGDMSWTNDMVWIPGGTFSMGATNGQTD